MPRALITYCRVSTKAQGRSGLGLDAQREALARFVVAEEFEIVREFIEIETGKGADARNRRPQLTAALAEARRRGAKICWEKTRQPIRADHVVRAASPLGFETRYHEAVSRHIAGTLPYHAGTLLLPRR